MPFSHYRSEQTLLFPIREKSKNNGLYLKRNIFLGKIERNWHLMHRPNGKRSALLSVLHIYNAFLLQR